VKNVDRENGGERVKESDTENLALSQNSRDEGKASESTSIAESDKIEDLLRLDDRVKGDFDAV
jgi:hypothetical protein